MTTQTLPRLSFAPLEGITGWVFRQVHQRRFPGLDRYYAPFFAPTTDSPLTGRGLSDLQPDHNQGVPVVPQLLANQAEAFLADIFSRTDLAISIKTRIGVEDAAEWPALLAIFRRYPIRELIIHPRLRRDFYRGPVRQGAFQYAVDHCDLPLCYNGDLFTPQACRELAAQFPSVSHWMAGRGLVYNPALGRQLQGGEPLTPEELRAFHDQLVEAYRQVLSGDRPVLGKMKELWFYWSRHFLQPEGPLKRIRKAKTLLEYRDGVNALFRDCPFQEEGPVTF